MRVRLCTLAMVACALLALPAAAAAQGGTTSTISGIVADTAGGVIPGADVVVRHNATGVTTTGVTNERGAFSFPGLNPGTYTVTVTLQGFKTFVANDVVLTSGSPAAVRAVLEVGGITEQVVVSSTSEIVQTQSSTVSSTINTNQIVKLPLTSRSAMDFVTFLPGVTTADGNRQSQINGLPRGLINITLDGVNIQDNTLRSTDGFFAIVSPRLDAIEEVTVTTATQGADGAGQGAVQIKFVTRAGTNDLSGSGYHYFRSDKLNANTWFNNREGVDKTPLKQNQYGFRVGGPIVIPGLFDGRNKAFFFVNYEEFRQPGGTTRNRTLLNTQAQQGLFSYSTPSGVRSVNLMALAAANGQTATFDPTVAALLGDIRSAVSGGALSEIDPNLDRFRFNVETQTLNRYPTFRVDYNITDKHRLSSALNYQRFDTFPDTLNSREATFPGFPIAAGQESERIGFSNSVRSTLGANLVNEARVGYSGAPVTFFGELTPSMWDNTKGFHLDLGNIGSNLTDAGAVPRPQGRNATSLLIENTLTWLKGTHSFSMGGSWTQFTLRANNSNMLPEIDFGVVQGDPALGMFNASNFPGASNAVLGRARNLYALLTGRVSQVVGDARLNESTGEYDYMGVGIQRARMREAGFFLQDSWRWTPQLTLNLGLRYELQFPFYPLNSSYSTATLDDLCGISGRNPQTVCNLFQPGVTGGKRPEFINFGEGTPAYNTDYDNWAPSVGFAWTPTAQSGFLGKVLGQQGDTVLRGGFTRSFSRNGMNDFSGQFNSNPGIIIQNPLRNVDLGTLNLDGRGLPVLFRQDDRLGPAPFPTRPIYPLSDVETEDLNIFDPDIQVPYADSWTFGVQRAIGRSMAVEVRYVGTRSRDNWQVLDFNEVNIFDNGFLNEFRSAQANLAANIAAGNGPTFAFTGAPGTAPLPIFLAFFNGRDASQAANPAAYTGGNWTSSTFQSFLAARNPNPFEMVTNDDDEGILNNAAFRRNAANAGLPRNFFVANPDLLAGGDLTTNLGRTNFHGLQVELRRSLAQGLQFNSSYAFGRMETSSWLTHRRPQLMVRDTGSPGDITHAFKLNAIYELPFGQGRRFGSNVNGFVDRLIGGWSVSVASRIQSGTLVNLGNVRLVGMSVDDVFDMYQLRIDHEGQKVWMLPQDVIDNTIKAFSVSATSPTGYSSLGAPTGRYFAPANGPDCIEPDHPGVGSDDEVSEYGVCGARQLVVSGPMFRQHDISIGKRVNIVGRTNFEFRVEMLNAFNYVNFEPEGGIGNDIADYEVTSLLGQNTARVIQLVTRINW